MPSSEIPHASGCPDENALAALAEGALPDDDARLLREHLDACEPCRTLAAAAVRMAYEEEAERSTGAATLLERALPRPRVRLTPGSALGRYVVGAMLGEGGMGTVYGARDPGLDREVAIKVVTSGEVGEDAGKRRLLREARAAAKLSHTNIVTVFDVGEVNDITYVAMELIAGRSLRAFVGDAGISLARRRRWLADVARALAAAHRQGLVHRDIKPENVMVRADDVVKVVDFGIARHVERADEPGESTGSTVTVTGALIGTPTYMAPEQLRGEPVDASADQFAWGVLAFELVSGKRPWTGRGLALASQISSLEAPALTDCGRAAVPPALAATIRRAMSKAASDRFATMDDLLVSIERARDRPSRAPLLIAGAIMLVIAGVIGARLMASSRTTEAHTAPPPSITTETSRAAAAPATAVVATESVATATASAPSSHTRASARPLLAPSVVPPAPAVAPSATTTATASAKPRPKPDCDPPYTWRGGVKTPKPECPLD